MSQLQALAVEDIKKIASEINMPDGAVDRLLEILNKKHTVSEKNTTKKKDPTSGKKTVIKTSSTTVKNKQSTNTTKTTTQKKDKKDLTKTEASDYYHFKSTPKELAHMYNAKKVDDPEKARWKTAFGASAWNPGNTYESRDYSKFCRGELKTLLVKHLQFGDDLTIENLKTSGDYTIVSSRGKIKYVHDLKFSFTFEMFDDDNKKISSGELKVKDIFPDDECDDWEYTWENKKKENRSEFNKAKKIFEKKFPEICNEISKLCKEIRAQVIGK